MPDAKDEPERTLGSDPRAGGEAAAGSLGRACLTAAVHLTDGTQVSLRAIRPDDEAALTALYERLSPQTAYQRFFTAMRRLPPNWAHILANVDYERRMAIVAVDPDGELIGVARYMHDPRADETEIAIVIEDRWQGRGLGKRLLTELIGYAADRGIRRLRAYVLADNVRMLKLLRRVTTILDRKFEAGVISLLLAPLGHSGSPVDASGVPAP